MTNSTTQTNTHRDDVICDCTGTTKAKIQQLIDEGAGLEQISDATGACTGCGACDILVMGMLGS